MSSSCGGAAEESPRQSNSDTTTPSEEPADPTSDEREGNGHGRGITWQKIGAVVAIYIVPADTALTICQKACRAMDDCEGQSYEKSCDDDCRRQEENSQDQGCLPWFNEQMKCWALDVCTPASSCEAAVSYRDCMSENPILDSFEGPDLPTFDSCIAACQQEGECSSPELPPPCAVDCLGQVQEAGSAGCITSLDARLACEQGHGCLPPDAACLDEKLTHSECLTP